MQGVLRFGAGACPQAPFDGDRSAPASGQRRGPWPHRLLGRWKLEIEN